MWVLLPIAVVATMSAMSFVPFLAFADILTDQTSDSGI
jgi:hypothetical protein